MTDAAHNSTSVAMLMGMPVIDANGRACGRVKEIAVDVANDDTHIAGFVVGKGTGSRGETCWLPVTSLAGSSVGGKRFKAKTNPVAPPTMDGFVLMDRDLLDQQIIDVDGRKVVRVNDVDLAWESGAGGPELRIADVEVGLRGAARRILKGLPSSQVFGISNQFTARAIPWTCVDLIDRDPARRVKLKIEQARLAKLHPSDIAAILEDLAPHERDAVFTSLDEETAAETLEEVDPKMQKALLKSLNSERAADIIEEMDTAAAADLLSELSEEESEAILEEMEPEDRHDVEELLEFSPDTAAGSMTKDFVDVAQSATVAEAIDALRVFEGDADTITEIYLLNEQQALKGVVTLPRLLLAQANASLATLGEGHMVTCKLHDSQRHVAELFDKYNLRSLPVVDHAGKLIGVIHAEQVIAQLREG